MPRRSPRLFILNLAVTLVALLPTLSAQEPTAYLTPDVLRVGHRLACRCGGCRNTVGDCPMLHCGSSDPLRRRIFEMKQHGKSDDEIVNTIVKEEGIVALASLPTEGLGPIITWAGPGIALLLGFFVYLWYVRRNQKQPDQLLPIDQAVLERFQTQIDREFDDSKLSGGPAKK